MAEKRRRDDGNDHEPAYNSTKKIKHGFRVGPANLPDGTYKRHNDKIKKNLIERAHIKKQYSKMKQRISQQSNQALGRSEQQHDVSHEHDQEDSTDFTSPNATLHPDRVRLLSHPENAPDVLSADESSELATKKRSQEPIRQKQQRPTAFDKQSREAKHRNAEAETRRRARAEAEQERQDRLAERERHRKIMTNARTVTGQRKLGRESTVLLDRVKRMMKNSR